MTLRSLWQRRVWAALVFIGVLLEVIGLKRRTADDTFSEYVWSKTKTVVMRSAVGALMTWLAYHFTLGARGDVGRWDLLAAFVGIILGVISRPRDFDLTSNGHDRRR